MIELLKFLLCKEHYHSLRSYVPRSSDSTVQYLYALLDTLQEHAQNDVTWDEYEMYVLANLPNVTKHDKDNTEIAKLLLTKAKAAEVSPDIAHTTLDALRKRQAAFEAASVMLDYSEGRKSQEELSKALESLSIDDRPLDDFDLVDEGLEELFNTSVLEPGLRWRLKCKNESIGSLRKGDFGFIFARPEVGKTTDLCSESSFMLLQMKQEHMLYITNEELSSKVKMRWAQSYFGITRREMLANLAHYSERFKKEIGERLVIPRESTKDYKYIEKLCRTYEPGLIVIDALDAVEGFKADREDLRLGVIFKWAQELSKEYCPIIGVTWADGTAEGVKWLNMGHVVNAKTEKQKPAQWIYGIGKSNDANLEHVRHISIMKNKCDGDQDTDPAMRHARYDVIIDAEHARFRDIE